MEALLKEVLPELGLDFCVHDVDSDPDWKERFGDVVPVLLRDGRPVAKLRLDRRQLVRLVERHR
jgi:hypothetical protein